MLGVMVFADWADKLYVLLPLMFIAPATPEETYPAEIEGETDWLPDTLAVIFPELLTLIVGATVIEVAGVDALPLETLLLALDA